MTAPNDKYELLDFGDGRKLERFGGVVLDRPCPAADSVAKLDAALWRTATACYEAPRVGDGEWRPAAERWLPRDWRFVHDGVVTFQLALDALPSGQVGVFPEQRGNWDWIVGQTRKARAESGTGRASGTQRGGLRVLNLFGYRGGSTLAAAAAGAEVVHVDAARGVVERRGRTRSCQD